jgi:hypothetical protein
MTIEHGLLGRRSLQAIAVVATLTFVPSTALAIGWTQVMSYFDGGTFVSGKVKLSSNGPGTLKRLKYKAKSDAVPPSDGIACTLDETVCVTTALFSFVGTPTWVDIVTRPDIGGAAIIRTVDICTEMPALCAPGVTVTGGVFTVCYAPDALSLPPPAFTYPMATSVCEGAYTRPLTTYPPATPTTPILLF